MQGEESTAEEIPRAATMPSNLQFSARGFADEEYAKEAIYKLHTVLSVISQSIDLTKLDGVTIAFDYDQALAELDRGYETAYKLTASKGIAIGVAMAPRVIREGVVKTHFVLNANYALSILEKPGEESDYFFQSLHLIAHECAHVEVTAAFDECFPGFLLQKAHSNILDNMRWQVILAAWDEYAACRIAGSIGYDPAGGYLETLVKVLSDTRVQCYAIIKAYRIHGDVGQVATEVYGKLGDLLKYSSYFLGAIAAQDAPEERPAALVEGSEFDWFSPFYDRLIEAHGVLWGAFGKWERLDAFEAVGDILQDMADSVGVEATRQPDDLIYFDIPLRRESMPDSDLSDPVMRALFDIDALVK